LPTEQEKLAIPKPLLYAGILVFATLGAYSLHQSTTDLVILYVFGLLGFVMRRWDIPWRRRLSA
jgi:putative tricarboxylic transport membrane protein